MDAVTLRHVDKAYTSYSTEIVITGEQRQSRTRQVLKDLSVTFAAGQLTVIVGRSGCGKSTLLKLLAGKEQPDAGEISIPQGLAQRHAEPRPLCHHLDERAAQRRHGLRRRQDAGGAV